MLIAENKTRLASLLDQVRKHPMCAKLDESAGLFLVTYPAGDFPVDGVQARFTTNKAVALCRLLTRMEKDWVGSLPGATKCD